MGKSCRQGVKGAASTVVQRNMIRKEQRSESGPLGQASSAKVTHCLGVAAGIWALQRCLQLTCRAGGDVGDAGTGCVAARLAQPCLHNVREPRDPSDIPCSVASCRSPADIKIGRQPPMQDCHCIISHS